MGGGRDYVRGFPLFLSAVVFPSCPIWPLLTDPECLSLAKVINTNIPMKDGEYRECCWKGSITDVERKLKNYHTTTSPGQSLSKKYARCFVWR
jgi:hypothetical protein